MIYRDKKVNSFGGKEGNLEEGDKKYEGNYQNAPTIENQEINMVKTNSNI